MKERGQIFTLDMFFALTLTVLVVSYSGLALEQARRQAEEYSLRYSLERTANDAADVLVKTTGYPSNWEENFENLVTIGLVMKNKGEAVQNALDVLKWRELWHLTAQENWDSEKPEVQAVRALFDNQDFEIVLINENTGENLLPPIWGGHAEGENSGVENSLEVAVAKRLVAIEPGYIQNRIIGMLHLKGRPVVYHAYFNVGQSELDTYDWYILLETNGARKPVVWIFLNRPAQDEEGSWDYQFPESKDDDFHATFRPRWHGLDDNDLNHPDLDPKPRNPDDFVVLHEGANYMEVRVPGDRDYTANLYILAFPRCSPSDWAWILEEYATLEVKVWR